VIERFFRTLKQKCVWLHHFEFFEEAERVILAWIDAATRNGNTRPRGISPLAAGVNSSLNSPRRHKPC